MRRPLHAPGFAPAPYATDQRPLIVILIAAAGLNIGIVAAGRVVSMLILLAL